MGGNTLALVLVVLGLVTGPAAAASAQQDGEDRAGARQGQPPPPPGSRPQQHQSPPAQGQPPPAPRGSSPQGQPPPPPGHGQTYGGSQQPGYGQQPRQQPGYGQQRSPQQGGYGQQPPPPPGGSYGAGYHGAPSQPRSEPVRREIAYEPGMPMPDNAQIRERSRMGLWIPGLVVFGVWWIGTVVTWWSYWAVTDDASHAAVIVPVAGPAIHAFNINDGDRDAFVSLLAFDTVAQGVGMALLIAGLTAKKKTVVYWEQADRHLMVTPMAGRNRFGLHLTLF